MNTMSNVTIAFILTLSLYGVFVLGQQLHEFLATYISSTIFFG